MKATAPSCIEYAFNLQFPWRLPTIATYPRFVPRPGFCFELDPIVVHSYQKSTIPLVRINVRYSPPRQFTIRRSFVRSVFLLFIQEYLVCDTVDNTRLRALASRLHSFEIRLPSFHHQHPPRPSH